MKKAKLFLSLAILIILSAIPTMAYADTVDTISEEFGYEYRWTVEAELDSTYEDYWIYDLTDNGKIKISYIKTENLVASMRETEGGVVVLQGNKEMVLGCRMTNTPTGFTLATELVNNDGTWSENSDSTYVDGTLHIFIHATGDNKVDGRFLLMYVDDLSSNGISPTTPITLDEAGVDAMEDTELLLAERTTFYQKYKYGHTAEGVSPNGNVITARPVIREDMKKPIIDNDVFKDDNSDNEEDMPDENLDDEAVENIPDTEKIPDFDVTLAEIQKATENEWLNNNVIDGINYGVEVLNGKHMTRYICSVLDGKMTFDINVSIENVSEISQDGKITVNVQRFDRYRTDIPSADLIFEPYTYVKYNDNIILVALKGDLGEKVYCLRNATKSQTELDGKYYMTAAICPVYEMDENIVVYEYQKETGEKDSDGDAIMALIDTPKMYVEYADRSYCGIETIGLVFGEDIYTINADSAKIDFDVEVDLSDKVVGTDAAKKLIKQLRQERTTNNDVENILTDNDVNIKMQITPTKQENDEQQEIKDDEGIKIILNGKKLEFADQEPVIVNDRVLVPLRVIFEELGADVSWNGEKQEVTMQKDGVTVSLIIGAAELIKNGEKAELDAAAEIQNERTLVPIRAITESFGNTVTWDGNNKIVEIK